jgi:lysophospholipase L1-like esterase
MRWIRSSFAVSVAIAGLLFLASELGLRLLTGKDSRWNVRMGASKVLDPVAGFRLKPFYDLGEGIRTNELGYRAPLNLPRDRPADRLRIIYLGDSNSVTPRLENYPAQAEAMIAEALGAEVETVNAGVPGYSSLNARLLFEHELSHFDAHHFVVYLGWNDLGQYGPEGLPYKLHEQGYRVSPLQRMLSQIYTVRFVFAAGHAIRRLMPTTHELLTLAEADLYERYEPSHFTDNMRAILRRAKERYPHVHVLNIATLTSKSPTQDEFQRMHFPTGMSKNARKLHALVLKYKFAVEEVAEEEGLEVIDIFSLFDSTEARRTFTDSCHMNREGAGRMAKAVADAIVRTEVRSPSLVE